MQRYHFRPYSPNQTILFPQRIDKDIADDDLVRLISSIVESLDLSSFRKLYRERGLLLVNICIERCSAAHGRHTAAGKAEDE
ncbi:MAG: hypothetical protein IKQ62_02330, partial [Bacteroidaceae bacterium]|nr:hypothetical protein [Bacteroidaceae bacterium]